ALAPVAEPELDFKPMDPPASPSPAAAPPTFEVDARPTKVRNTGTRPRPLPPPTPTPKWKVYGRWVMGLALLPLILSLFTHDDPGERLKHMLQTDPKLAAKIDQLEKRNGATMDDLFEVLPENRIEGAYVARNSKVHWLFAVLSAAIF